MSAAGVGRTAMYRITDHVGNETIEEASDAELAVTIAPAGLAMLRRTGAVEVPHCGGTMRFELVADA